MNDLRWYSVGFGVFTLAAATAVWIWNARRVRPDREQIRRLWLSRSGRLTTGMTLDLQESQDEKNELVRLLIYRYDIAGVAYEASQDITKLQEFLDLRSWRLGQLTSVRYDPHNPGNSIVISETWNGLRS
jgi:hypothetical protein